MDWKKLLGQFYGGFEKELRQAEQDTERIKVPDEVSDVICPKCGRNLVYKSGRFGRFLACPGWPECDHTQPIVKTSKRGFAYYGCENNTNRDEARRCDFMTWDVPVKDNCPSCGHTLFKKSGRGFKRPFCINPDCPNFLPEDQRGYQRKTAKTESGKEGEAGKKAPAKKATAKKPAAKKTTAKKTTARKTKTS